MLTLTPFRFLITSLPLSVKCSNFIISYDFVINRVTSLCTFNCEKARGLSLGCLSIQPGRSRFFAQSRIEVRGFTPTSVVCLLLAVIMVSLPVKRSRGVSWWECSRNSRAREK